jgi:hypothetical protein
MSHLIPPNSQKEKQKTANTDATFRNYCLFMDGSKYNRNIACKRHDNAYGIKGGGGEMERIKADKEFFNHLKSNKDPLAFIAYWGVRFYGWLFFNYKKTMPWRGQLIKKIFPKWFK